MKRRGNKYGAKRVEVDGRMFDSKREACRYGELKLLEQAGQIQDLQLQVPIDLKGKDAPILTPTGRQARYVVDFLYWDRRAGRWVFEDAKGAETEVFKLKRAILAAQGVEVITT